MKKKTPKSQKASAPTATKSAVPMVEIKNRERRMLVLNLDAPGHSLKRKFPVIRELRNGTSVGEMVAKHCADSVTLLARGTATIPKSALASTDVQNAIRAKKIVVIEKRAS